jgi:drug/metabolite transporter (DMT)-like permease
LTLVSNVEAEILPSDIYAEGRPSSKVRVSLLVVAVTLLNALGNLCLAWGMKHAAVRVALDPFGYMRDMLNPFVALGIGLLILWLLTRMALLSWADLSFVLPVTAFGYFLAAVLGKVFLQENISSAQWLGTGLIFVGIALVGGTRQKTGSPEIEVGGVEI